MQIRPYFRKDPSKIIEDELELERIEKSRKFKSAKEARREFIAKKCGGRR